ncbi:outer membrane lipoprotein carrier protein LolA [uncultured Jatrophihabitans sp.]|uniref:LolA family protein n=1 Tax=uncultured Jatrophihabitans sp. TaxID=1610747 RepID=UPI0035CAC6C4
MSILTAPSDRTRRRLTWAAPVVVAGVVAGAVALSGTNASGATPNLPARSPAQLLTAVQTSTATSFSGQVSETAALGIPTLPGGHSRASLSWQTFLSGTHTARVWADGADKQRVALIGELSEADVVHRGIDLWTYTSDTNTVTHSTIPANGRADATPSAADATPAAVAARVLEAVSPTTAVTVDTAQRVAGRNAYTLVLAPRDTRSTVQKVTIAIDAKKFIPLRVQVFGSGSTPAFSTGFTSISFSRPAASTFAFTAPKGATTSTDPLGLHSTDQRHDARPSAGASPRPGTTEAKPIVLGSGWTSVLELPKGTAAALGGSKLHDLTSAVGTSGDRLLHTALVNALILPDGRAFVGGVTPALLERMAATHPR